MHIDVALTPAEIALLPQGDLSGTTCVVFDVLRATSTMITALASGATEIYPACTIEEAHALRARLPDAVLGGERHGDLIPGFDLGNSPLEYRDAVSGRAVISTTTNGTVALRACERAERVLVGAVLNLEALAAELRRAKPEALLLVCAGTFEHFAMEDAWAAGTLILQLRTPDLSDAAQCLAALAALWGEPLSVLQQSRNGRVLTAKGRAAEVEWCARKSQFKVVGQMRAGAVRPLPA